jgi:hypothetical protein
VTAAEEVVAMADLRATIDALSQTDRGRDLLRRLLIIMRMSR